jgi:hypothetical protein
MVAHFKVFLAEDMEQVVDFRVKFDAMDVNSWKVAGTMGLFVFREPQRMVYLRIVISRGATVGRRLGRKHFHLPGWPSSREQMETSAIVTLNTTVAAVSVFRDQFSLLVVL